MTFKIPEKNSQRPAIKTSISQLTFSEVSIVFGPQGKSQKRTITQLTSDDIGSLVVVKAIVVRSSVVKPEIVVATYGCDVCGC